MHKVIAFISVAFGGLSLVSLGFMLYAWSSSAGMAILAFQLWTVIAALVALVLGGLSRFISHRKSVRHALPAKLGILAGALSLVILAGLLMFAG